jgi:CO/xanthine dehydrogenase Mo-binding subunit
VQVDYDPLPVVADPFTAKKDEVLLRPDREKKTNHIYHWEVGDATRADQALEKSEKRISSACGSSAATRRRSSRAAAWRISTPWAACSST